MALTNYLQTLPYWIWIFTVLVGLTTLYFIQHLYTIWSLPAGPFPLPVLGNLLAFRGEKNMPHFLVPKWRKKYGDVFTMWLGPRPTIMVCSWNAFKECLSLKRNDFAGRVERNSLKIVFRDAGDVGFSDIGPCWEALKKAMTSAVRKYSVSQKLADVIAEVVDEVVEIMLAEGKPVNGRSYAFTTVFNVLASSTFGKRFSVHDEDFIALKAFNDKMADLFGQGFPSDFFPFLHIFYKEKENQFKELAIAYNDFLWAYYEDHKKSYQRGIVRDFIDSLIAAKEEAEEKSKESGQYFTDQNIVNVIKDIFSGGLHTTGFALEWVLLHVASCSEIQRRMQKEIDEKIGSRQAIQSDRDNCPYTSAVIMEVLRKHSPFVFTLEHRSTCNSQIGEYKIPKDTIVMFYMTSIQHDENYWKDPEALKPERFLESDGKLSSRRMDGYAPFGAGRRGCPGEKLATADLFLIVTRILRQLDLELEGGPGIASSEFDVFAILGRPKHYDLVVKKRKH